MATRGRGEAEDTRKQPESPDNAEPSSQEEHNVEDSEQLVHKTYILKRGQARRLEQLAYEKRVMLNDLARFLVEYALQQVDSGELEIPTEPYRRKIAWPEK
jgi:hypothetical protein